MNIRSITLRQFRCFEEKFINLDSQVVILAGANGTGKTTICEALYYGCYARSFKTYTARELIAFDYDHSFLTINFDGDNGSNTLAIGLAHQKKLIKLNDQTITSAKTLLRSFPVVLLSELDMQLIQGGPAERRCFIDQYLLLVDSEYIELLKKLRVILAQRNALLQAQKKDSLDEWTRALWHHSRVIQEHRRKALAALITTVTQIAQIHVPQYTIDARYQSILSLDDTFESFVSHNQKLFFNEQRLRKSLFGAHLDDIFFTFNQTGARIYASRGQQKLIVLLLKSGVVRLLANYGEHPVVILDDIMSDFDEQTLTIAVNILLSLDCQLIFTSAQSPTRLQQLLESHAPQSILLNGI